MQKMYNALNINEMHRWILNEYERLEQRVIGNQWPIIGIGVSTHAWLQKVVISTIHCKSVNTDNEFVFPTDFVWALLFVYLWWFSCNFDLSMWKWRIIKGSIVYETRYTLFITLARYLRGFKPHQYSCGMHNFSFWSKPEPLASL
jgi:hypothetical protein